MIYYIRKLLEKILVSNKSMENEARIQTQIDILNGQESISQNRAWEPIDGYFAITGFNFGNNNRNSFNPSFGVPIKAFINRRTGEIKTYTASLFEDRNG